jgi:cytidyltransferase-like protein
MTAHRAPAHFRHVVWEGRFQPVHRGHVAYVGELLDLADTITLVVVANETSDRAPVASPVPDFSHTVDAHHADERNPWPLWLRHHMVTETLRSAFPDRAADIRVLAGHRLDLDWPLYQQLLAPERVFAVPLRDDFEDAKAKAWTELGEQVTRVDVSHLPEVSGTLVRELLARGEDLDRVLLPRTRELIASYTADLAGTGGRVVETSR